MALVRDSAHSENFGSKRRQILDAAYIVFSRKGFHRTTIDEIIAIADTGKGTVYNYFVNKEQLFYTLTQEISQPFEADLERAVTADTEPLDKLRRLVTLILSFYTKHGDLWRVLMHEMRGFGNDGYSHISAEMRDKYHSFFKRTIGSIEQVLTEGIATGVIRPCDTVVTAHGMFSVIAMMAFQKYVGEDAEAAAERVTETFFYGIVNK
ncbi:TetR family transcriptional regulator [Anaerosporomusa subterranea]|uniref:TetR family transcriptional regulator n=1 Tax=Anaerosporomusa subterranea TaxID=1794912 RepID=A0A154BMJ5_ANASB|nr:TetR/AcrR family transcriptional regulator [Anaerosporomusa subterranea]KYZ75207.1 TetR family transcriptional regulator [Anaerosporomusa subterranea]